jgi:hypothetical protein
MSPFLAAANDRFSIQDYNQKRRGSKYKNLVVAAWSKKMLDIVETE